MDRFGKFNGIPVYKTNLASYVGNKCYEDKENMYLIGSDLIYQNKIFGQWNGIMVNEYDPHKRPIFYKNTVTPKKSKPAPKPEVECVEPISVVETVSADDILAGVYAWKVG
jgi:hypothetical protein